MGLLALLGGLAVLTASAPEGPAVPPMQITIQMGTLQWVEPQIGAIRRVSVANPTIAQVEAVGPDRVSIQGLQVGRTLVLLWTDTGRTTILVKVEATPQERSTSSSLRQPAGPLAAAPGQSLYMYRGDVVGSGTGSPSDVHYTAMHHQLTGITPLLAGTASASVRYDAVASQPGRVAWAHLGYTDPLYSFELGDLSLSTLSVFGAAPVVRGGMGSYHDGKYRLLVFGGITPEIAGGLYGIDGTPQYGMQTQFEAADNLSFQLQAFHSGNVDAYGGPLTTVSPAVHWSPLTTLSLDAEGSMHAQGRAARARFAYDAPLLSVHGLYQTLGSAFLSPAAERADLGQIMLILTPSAYYRLSGSVGLGTSGGSLMDTSSAAVARMADASMAIMPNGMARGAVFQLDYSLGDNRDDRGLGGATSGRTLQRLVGSVTDHFGGLTYRLLVTAQDDRFDSTNVATDARSSTDRRSLGGTAQIDYSILGSAISGSTGVTYERRQQRDFAPVAADSSFDYWQGSQGLLVSIFPITLGIDGLLGQQMTPGASSSTWGARATLALRPSAAHELRAQAWVMGGTQLNDWEGIPYETQASRYYTGTLSYTYAFGSAVDAEPMFGLLGGGDVDVSVFLDQNEDGIRGDAEPGVEGITVVVDNDDRRASDGSGYAHVGHLRPGDHTLRVELSSAAGYRFTTASTKHFSLQRDGRERVEIGVSNSGQVFGTVFNDLNMNGELDPGEPGVNRVVVAIGNDEQGLNQLRSIGGRFVFRGLGPGDYVVGIAPRSFPRGYVWGGRNGDPKVKGRWYSAYGGSGSSNGVPAGSNGYPTGSNGVPAGSNGYSAGSNGVPAGSNGYSAGSNGVPPGSNGYPAGSNGVPAGSNGYAPGSNGVPAGSNGYAPGSNGIPPGSNGYAPGSNGIPPGSNGYAPGSNGAPAGSNGYRGPRPRLAGVYKIVHVGVERSETSVVRIPLRALRAISGRVYVDRDRDHKFSAQDEPAANVTVRIGNRQATTDAQGRYMFRDLPAGPVTLSVDALTLPRGRVLASPGSVTKELSAEPTFDTVDFLLTVPM